MVRDVWRTASSARKRLRSASSDLDAQHHPAVLMLDVVAMEHIGLRTRERHREAECHANALAGPDEDRVLAPQFGCEAAAFVDGQRVNEIRRRFALEHLE